MKRIFSKIILLFCLAFLAFQTFAQKKPVALKFDEFSKSNEYLLDSEMISQRLKRFIMQLKSQPQMRAVIIGYDERKQSYGNDYWIGDHAILILQRELENNGISEKRIIRLVGGIRENKSYEFWLLPKNADMPQPQPEFNQLDVIYCPSVIEIEGVDHTFDRNKTLEFSARIYRESPSQKLSYEWETSVGKVFEGQGTEKIKIDVSRTTENYLIVKLKINGLALECKNQVTKNINFTNYPFKIAEFKKEYENLKVYPDILFMELTNNPQLQSKIFIYGSRNVGAKSVLLGIAKLKEALKFRNLPLEKFPYEIGGFREDLTYEIWIYPKGVEPPKPTPTVDDNFVFPTKIVKKKRTPAKPKR